MKDLSVSNTDSRLESHVWDRHGFGFHHIPDADRLAWMEGQSPDTEKEEIVNVLTHGGGLLLAVGGAAILFSSVAGHPSGPLRLSCWVYATSLMALYGVSTLSHSFANPDRRSFFRSLDQGMIFVFIAANFTPFVIAHLPTFTCWLIVSLLWTLAVVGFTSKVFWRHRIESISITHYLAMAWIPSLVMLPILQSLPVTGFLWFAAGGLCYTIGTIFLALDTRVRYFHALWHVLVIAGSSCHFYVVLDYVIPLNS
ncbi:MAG: hemolysin III family protein [Fuerstiella sp.]|nr:hemolysin III family protein [Fuerstiella sp.]